MREPLEVFDEYQVIKAPFVDAVLDGFRYLYRWIGERRTAWMSAEGPLAWWNDCRVRVILRPTKWYDELGRALRIARADGRGDVRERIAGILRSGEGAGNSAIQWTHALAAAELEVLERGDTPYWTASPASHDLIEAGGVVISGMVSGTGAARMAQRASRAGPQDLDRQCWLIRTYLALR